MKPNSFILMDDLHWCDDEKKFIVLSKDEIEAILLNCVESGIGELDEIMEVIRWAERCRTAELLIRGVTKGRLKITDWDGEEPSFAENTDDDN